MRKGSEVPYLSHLMAVASIVLEHGADEAEAIAALLHDAVEDAGGRKRYEDIRVRFGDRVAGIVSECTNKDKRDYVQQIPTLSPSARLVSVADKLHNSRAILRDFRMHGDAVWDRFTSRKEKTLWYYRALADAFNRIDDARCNPITAELNLVVTAIEAHNAQNRGSKPMTQQHDDLERFVTAQSKSYEGYASALAELRAGHKQTHWIWYVFPNIRPRDPSVGSPNTQKFGLSDDREALRYLRHPVLGPRLAEVTAVVRTQLDKDIHPEVLLMWDKDVTKVRSCMELFLRVAAKADAQELPWLPTFAANAKAVFAEIDCSKYRRH